MCFEKARKLKVLDLVTIKRTGWHMRVLATETQLGRKQVNIMLDDGNWYNHKEVS